MNRLIRWIRKRLHKEHKYTGIQKRFVDMDHDEQIQMVKETMAVINYIGTYPSLSENQLTVVQNALSVYLNLLRGNI